MGLLGGITRRQSAEDPEDSEDLDFDDEMVDSLDMPGDQGAPHVGFLGKILKRRGKGGSEDENEDENEDEDDDEDDDDDDDGQEDLGNAGAPAAPEEDSPVQVVRLEGIPDVRPVGDANSNMTPGQEQTGPALGREASAAPSPSPAAGTQPAASSSPAEGNTPVDPATATEDDATEDSGEPEGDGLALSLQDIFGEEEEVNESLRDLADFVEEVLAQELAGGLREFLEQLEARQT